DGEVANGPPDLAAAVGPDKEPPQTFRRNVGGYGFGVNAGAGFFQARFTQIRSEDLDGELQVVLAHVLQQADGHGISIFACGASGDPNAHGIFRNTTVKNYGKHFLPQRLEAGGFSAKTADIDEDVL